MRHPGKALHSLISNIDPDDLAVSWKELPADHQEHWQNLASSAAFDCSPLAPHLRLEQIKRTNAVALLRRAINIIKDLQWYARQHGTKKPCCPACGNTEDEGHYAGKPANCPIAEMLLVETILDL